MTKFTVKNRPAKGWPGCVEYVVLDAEHKEHRPFNTRAQANAHVAEILRLSLKQALNHIEDRGTMSVHPAIQAYIDLFEQYTSDNAPGIPYAQDPVGTARLEIEWNRRGINVPKNIVDQWNWWIEIGGERTARRLCRKWRKTLRAQEPQ